jgi:beta-N-acetylhexosaminidase
MKTVAAKLVILYLILFSSIMLTSCGLVRNETDNSSETVSNTSDTEKSEEPENTEKPSEPEGKELLRLDGIVSDISGDIIEVMSADGKKYSFDKSSVIVQADGIADITGFPVTVYYYGSLDEALETQKIQLEKITVDTSDALNVRALRILDSMSLEEKVGQMFIVRCPEKAAAELVSEYHPGGYILFANDFRDKTKNEAKADIQSYQAASEIKMLIAADEEGGRSTASAYLKSSAPFPSGRLRICMPKAVGSLSSAIQRKNRSC